MSFAAFEARPEKAPKPTRAAVEAENRRRQLQAAARLFARQGPRITLDAVRSAAGVGHSMPGVYVSVETLLEDLLIDHLLALTGAVCTAQDHFGDRAPEVLLEQLIRAWLEAMSLNLDAHRAYLFCRHRLNEQQQRALDLRLRLIIELMQAALSAAVPALPAARPDAALLLFPAIRAALSDPYHWPDPPDPAMRQADARRITGMLIAVAEAEAIGHWPRLGRLEGAEPGTPRIELSVRRARAGFRELLDAAEEGADILIKRRGKPAVRMVGERPMRLPAVEASADYAHGPLRHVRIG